MWQDWGMSNDITRIHTGEIQNLTDRFAHRAAMMKPSEIRSLFAVASRPDIVSLAGGMPNLSAFPMEMMASVIAKLISDMVKRLCNMGVARDIQNFVSKFAMLWHLKGFARIQTM